VIRRRRRRSGSGSLDLAAKFDFFFFKNGYLIFLAPKVLCVLCAFVCVCVCEREREREREEYIRNYSIVEEIECAREFTRNCSMCVAHKNPDSLLENHNAQYFYVHINYCMQGLTDFVCVSFCPVSLSCSHTNKSAPFLSISSPQSVAHIHVHI
jgi:hypothetical protein